MTPQFLYSAYLQYQHHMDNIKVCPQCELYLGLLKPWLQCLSALLTQEVLDGQDGPKLFKKKKILPWRVFGVHLVYILSL